MLLELDDDVELAVDVVSSLAAVVADAVGGGGGGPLRVTESSLSSILPLLSASSCENSAVDMSSLTSSGLAAAHSAALMTPSPSVSRLETVDVSSSLSLPPAPDIPPPAGGGGGALPLMAESSLSSTLPLPSASSIEKSAADMSSLTSSGFAAANSDALTEPSPSVSRLETDSCEPLSLPELSACVWSWPESLDICSIIAISIEVSWLAALDRLLDSSSVELVVDDEDDDDEDVELDDVFAANSSAETTPSPFLSRLER